MWYIKWGQVKVSCNLYKKFKNVIKKTKTGQVIIQYLQISLRERFLNWFVQKAVYRTQSLTFSLHFTSRIVQAQNLKLGENVWPYLARSGHCYIQANNGVEIGDDTIIGPGVKIISANHNITDYKKHDSNCAIKIGCNCWLAANSIILPGVQLGDNVIVGAGAVVTKSFPSHCIIAGVPAKFIKTLESSIIEGEQQ